MRSILTTLAALAVIALAASCTQANLFEKNVSLPGGRWPQEVKPKVTFEITDTASSYNVFFVIRHTEAYGYNNIYVRIGSSASGDTAMVTKVFDLPLASQNKWLASGMDDIYEHRVLLYSQPVRFRKTGTYTFTLEQLMRENPLEHVMNVGLRVEKLGS
jgi:gliding motility-associated lipoprotein GldH